jgi:hypothetical protein
MTTLELLSQQVTALLRRVAQLETLETSATTSTARFHIVFTTSGDVVLRGDGTIVTARN